MYDFLLCSSSERHSTREDAQTTGGPRVTILPNTCVKRAGWHWAWHRVHT